MKKTFRLTAIAAAFAAMPFMTSQALAGGVIYNTGNSATATVLMGINDEGHLNWGVGITSNGGADGGQGPGAAGVAYRFPDGSWRDSTSPGCLCEGWGVSVNGTTSGFANISSNGGANNLSLTSFTLTTVGADPNPSKATSIVTLSSLPGIEVTQTYEPSAASALFVAHVKITNTTGADVSDLQYVRVMDWDVPPTEFNEFVSIVGTGFANLAQSGDNGFYSADPLTPYTNAGYDPDCDNAAGGGNDCIKSGIDDHGAYFKFNFGTLLNGESKEFDIFYGGAANEAAILAALAVVAPELYSLGYSNNGAGGVAIDSPVYAFAFKGVGGVVVIPEPATLALFGLGLAGLALGRKRKGSAIEG